jgi:phenylpropionate dioxygenase-like ring-hydroxylating dioxygenase large terminal subunit
MSFLRNCWYMATWSSELEPAAPMARKFLDVPVVLFRDSDGVPHALLDRCPHRFAPLSKGVVNGDILTCNYHGLGFAGSGACASNPHGPVLRNMAVPSYAVHEAHRAIWIWMGDQDAADISLIPDFDVLEVAPDNAFSCGRIHSNGNYELFSDNLLDLTHADYLHANTVMGAQFATVEVKVKSTDDTVSIEYCFFDQEANILIKDLPGVPGRIDQRSHLSWHAPGHMILYIDFAPVGTNDLSNSLRFTNIHCVTPETATSTHYFFASSRNFLTDDAVANQKIAESRLALFENEDAPMIEAQQAQLGTRTLWELNPLSLKIDDAGVRARRILAAHIKEEQATSKNKDILQLV